MITSQAEAREAAKTSRTVTLTKHDAWGKLHSVTVAWMPQRCDVDAALSNVGKTQVVWADEPPIRLGLSAGLVAWRTDPVQVAGDTGTQTFEAVQVDTPDDLSEGCFCIVAES